VITDHRSLTFLLSLKKLNCRLHDTALKLMENDMKIVYRKGDDNSNEDGLSREAWVDEEDVMCSKSILPEAGKEMEQEKKWIL